jgi:hypothetical protein
LSTEANYTGNYYQSNIITNPISISGTSTIITQVSTLNSGIYTLTYNTTNILGLSNSINRTLQIYANISIPFIASNISWGYDSGPYQPPIYSNNNMTTSPCTNWFFNSTALSNINFNYNSNWTCVLKIKQATLIQLEVGWDFNPPPGSNYNTYQQSQGWLNAVAPIWCQIFGSASSFNSNVAFTTTVYNQSAISIAQTTGYYLEISYVNNYVGLVMKDLSYNILLSVKTPYTFINKKMPFYIWTNGGNSTQYTIFYTNGIFSQSGTPPTYNF